MALKQICTIFRHNLLRNCNYPVCLATVRKLGQTKCVYNRCNSKFLNKIVNKRYFCVSNELVDSVTFEKVSDETLESLCDYFEELVESSAHLQLADVTYGSGVLTVNFGEPYGTYVINRQSPNRQIWLSSPKSGPKRYDFVIDGKYWLYKHENVTLHQLLQEEITNIVKQKVDFAKCTYSLLSKK